MISKQCRGRAAAAHGFTLVELLTVVTIIAILAAIAIPAYGRYAYRARRVDGKELLLRLANAQERYYATYNRYGTLAELGYADPALSEKGYYSVQLPLASRTAFRAEATPQGAQRNDVCGTLSVDSAGAKRPDAASDANSNGPCW
jgi:type IV pilus assembly protein PilE